MSRPRKITLLAITVWLTAGLAASPARCATALQKLRQLCRSSTARRLHLGVRVVELVGKHELFALHADERFIPASNQKLVTTSAAISLLGAEFKYRTVLAALEKDLVVFASGDPTIGDPVLAERDGRGITALFEDWAALLKKHNLTRIAGDLYVDPSVFEKQYVHPSWQAKDLHRWYAAEVAGANFFDNCIELKLKPNAPGQPVSYTLRPNSRYVTVENSCRSVGAGGKQSIWLSRVLGTNRIILRGTCKSPTAAAMELTIHDPPAYFGFVLAETLNAAGINIAGKLVITRRYRDDGSIDPRAEILAVHTTPITDVIDRANKNSQNLMAEALLKSISAYAELPADMAHRQGSWADGAARIGKWLISIGCDRRQFVIDDGSGLSRRNRLSPRVLTQVLAHMAESKAFERFRQSLAVLGVDGTLRKRLTEPRYRGRAWAKSGYLSGVRSLSGYAISRDGKLMCFSIMMDKIPARDSAASRKLIDEICHAILDIRLGS